MKKHLPSSALFTLSTILLLFSSRSLCVSWFVSHSTFNPERNANSKGAYFAYGDGSAEHPYGIKEPRHLYNLAWLQDRGKFNEKDTDGKRKTTYFELADNIDRSGYTALPPIGTTAYPFIGNFNGNSKTITGLTISNDTNDFTRKPYTGIDEFKEVYIVGLFGVVGSYETGEQYGYDSSTNQILNTGISQLTVKSTSDKVLAGLVAGYVNGEIKGVGVNDSSFALENNPNSLTRTNNLSDYSLVGYVKDNKYLKEREQSRITTDAPSIDNPIAGQGGNDWGSSVARKDRYTTLHAKYEKADFPTYTTYEERTRDSQTAEFGPITRETSQDKEVHDQIYSYVSTDTENGKQTASYTFASGYNDSSRSGHRRKDDPYVGLSGKVDESWAKHSYVTRNITNEGNKNTFKLSDGKRNYLSATRNNEKTADPSVTITNNTRVNNAINLLFENGHLSFSRNNRVFYLNENQGKLSAVRKVKTSSPTTWSYDEEQQLYKTGSYYLVYDNGWKLSKKAVTENNIESDTTTDFSSSYDYFLFSRNDYYRTLPFDKDNDFVGRGNRDSAAKWHIDTSDENKIYAEEGGNRYYLYSKTGGPKNWNLLYVTTSNNNNYTYVTYRSSSSWWQEKYFFGATSSDLKIFYDDKGTNPNEYGYWSRNGKQQCTVTGVKECKTSKTESSTPWSDSEDTLNENVNELNDTYFPLTFNDNKTGPSDTNTGYVIGGGNYEEPISSGKGRSIGDIRVASYYKLDRNNFYNNYYNDLGNSCLDTNSTGATGSYSQYNFSNSNFFAYTIDSKAESISQQNLIKISDPINETALKQSDSNCKSYTSLGFSKYYRTLLRKPSGSRVSRGNLLSKDSTAYGLHFRNAEISTNNKITIPYAKVNGQEYDNYELPQDAIDFNLKTEGYINFFAGTYYAWKSGSNISSDSNNCFFSLHTIERNGNKISNIKEISRIYKNKEHASDKTQPSYVYLYSDNTSNTGVEGTDGQRITGTKGDLLFDTRVLTSPDSSEWVNWAAYYFEVPVNKGEFALGSVSKANKNGAYLRYLDIGAGNKDENNITIEEHSEIDIKTYKYPSGVDFYDVSSSSGSSSTEGKYKDITGGGTTAIAVKSAGTSDREFAYDKTRSTLNVNGPPKDSLSAAYLSPGRKAKAGTDDIPLIEKTSHKVVIDKLTTYEIPQDDTAESLNGVEETTITIDGAKQGSVRKDVTLSCNVQQASNILEFVNDSDIRLFTLEYSIIKDASDSDTFTYGNPVALTIDYDPYTRFYSITFNDSSGETKVKAVRTYFNNDLTLKDNEKFAGVKITNLTDKQNPLVLNQVYSFRANKAQTNP